MNSESLREYCLAKPHVTEGLPFGDGALVFKVAGKMFALLSLEPEQPLTMNLKCDPEEAALLREQYDGVQPGWHMNKQHWNTCHIAQLPAALMRKMIDHSYDLVLGSLPKKRRAELGL